MAVLTASVLLENKGMKLARRTEEIGRLFVGRLETSGYYKQLSSGLKSLGVPHDFITYWTHEYDFGGETHSPVLLQFSERFRPFSESRGQGLMRRLAQAVVRESLITLWAIGAIIKYDAFIFGFGETLLRGHIDLLAIRILRKPVIVNMAHGSEARPPYLDGSAIIEGEDPEQQARRLAQLTKRTFRRVRRIERWATHVIGAPYSTSQFSRRKFINHFAIGIPYSISSEEATVMDQSGVLESKDGRPLVVLHSPSNPTVKGTSDIALAVDNLRNAGYKLEFRVMQSRPNAVVLAALADCDLVVDQLYSDTPLAGFATEAAFMGRCSIVAGHALDELEAHIPEGMLPTSITCLPENLTSTLATLLDNPDYCRRAGKAAQRFVEDKWSSRAVAERFLRILKGDIPEDWWIDPSRVAYVHGSGMSNAKVKSVVKNLISYEGADALQLGDRPDLRDMLIASLDRTSHC